ncbi:hypothetical protein BVRB_1g014420 isoform B [Beta vulgaris subsp. vulgaris]|nr:hypothetical protein BVRB_1g014420 isoform B [Beta vulgaris subsp. vulgaris]
MPSKIRTVTKDNRNFGKKFRVPLTCLPSTADSLLVLSYLFLSLNISSTIHSTKILKR